MLVRKITSRRNFLERKDVKKALEITTKTRKRPGTDSVVKVAKNTTGNYRKGSQIGFLTRPIIGFKKVRLKGKAAIAVLRIPAGSLVRCGSERACRDDLYFKCRASKAHVLGFIGLRQTREIGGIGKPWFNNLYKFEYRKDYVVEPDSPFDEGLAVCASGIHFFLTRYEARWW